MPYREFERLDPRIDGMAPDKGPSYVPVLVEEDFCIGVYQSGARSCLLGWHRRVFGSTFAGYVVYEALDEAAAEVFPSLSLPLDVSLAHVNDVMCANKPHLRPEIWNRAMRKLGYVVIEELEDT